MYKIYFGLKNTRTTQRGYIDKDISLLFVNGKKNTCIKNLKKI